jgi:hypothetical protein
MKSLHWHMHLLKTKIKYYFGVSGDGRLSRERGGEVEGDGCLSREMGG